MERVNGHNLTPNTTYYIELDNDSLRQYGAYSAKHYGKFIKYVNDYAYFENIENISPFCRHSKNGYKSVGGVYWKFFKMKKYEIEKRITNSFIQQITGEKYFIYLKN